MSKPDPSIVASVLEVLDSGVIVLGCDHRVIVWNAWVAAASGIPTADAVGRKLEELFPQASLGRLILAIDEAFESGASGLLSHVLHRGMLPLKTRTAKTLLHNLTVRPVGPKPHAACVVQVFDVTLSTEREAVLRKRQNARYDAVVESAPDPILTMDAQGFIFLANPAAGRELGYSAADLIGRSLFELIEPSAAWDDAWRLARNGEAVHWPVELVVRRRDGSSSYLDASASRWSNGAGMMVTAILRDVNERRYAEAKLRKLNDTLEERVASRTADLERAHEQLQHAQKVEAIGQLTGGIAHDFNNLLTPILGGLDVLNRRGMPDPRGQRLVEGALQSAERARVLVQRLLAFARRQPLQLQPVDLSAIVRDMAFLVGSTIGPRIHIVTDAPENLPCAMADPNQLEMAVLNLAVNARDAMADGGTLSISVRSEDVPASAKLPAGEYVVLTVADTGVGMDAETLRRSVEPFYSTKGVGKGTGLGLSMIHGLAAQLGGSLEIASTPTVGTRVDMWLPAAKLGTPPAHAAARADEQRRGAGVVLLVDDEDLIRATTSQMLADIGYTVVEASSAAEAMPHMDDPDLVLLVTDHLMPGMTGTELARECRARRAELPILIISGYADVEDVAPDLPRLIKPFLENELAAALAALD